MSKLSVIVTSRWDYSMDEFSSRSFLPQTVKDIFAKAAGDIEVIVVLDGYWPVKDGTFLIPDNPNLVVIHKSEARGMRSAINSGAAVARGEFLAKCDDHCMFAEGFDEVLKADCDDDWVVVPRRFSLDGPKWKRKQKHWIDYLRIECPRKDNRYEINVVVWNEKNYNHDLQNKILDNIITFQGSFWMMHREYFHYLDLMDDFNYGSFRKEPQEITFNALCSGGNVVRNKKTWYAHLHKGRQFGRGYRPSKDDHRKGDLYLLNWLTDSAWPKQTIPFKEIIDRFDMPEWNEFDWDEMRAEIGAVDA